jgi:hypothetical protein
MPNVAIEVVKIYSARKSTRWGRDLLEIPAPPLRETAKVTLLEMLDDNRAYADREIQKLRRELRKS